MTRFEHFPNGSSALIRIESLSNARIKRLVRLRQHRERRREGVFLAEGQREIERAVQAGLTALEIYSCSNLWRGGISELLGGSLSDVGLFEVSEPVFRKIAYLQEPEGVLAVVRTPIHTLSSLVLPADALILVAVGTEKPGNLGAMARTAEAAGCHALIASGPVDAFNPNAIRASTGAVFSLPVVAADDEAIRSFLLTHAMLLAAATPGRNALPYAEVSMTGALAIVIGPEDRGLDEAWLKVADERGVRVQIPMPGQARPRSVVDSLNAANAAAILLFEAVRQRSLN